jgi:adenine-specific DNA-methyltransferase
VIYSSVLLKILNQTVPSNKLIQGDNLLVLNKLLSLGFESKIDLVYIDPPFATNNVFTFSEEQQTSMISNRKL